jgi:sialate O-acetylesterase
MKSILLFTALIFTQMLPAQLHLPSFLSDGMVLQQKKVNRIWGWAKADQLITVECKEKKYPAYANSYGEWEVFLDPVNAGQVGSIMVTAGDEKIELKNILAGEVWVCGGQSNMEWKMRQLADIYKEEMQTANNDNIRFVVVSQTFANAPQKDVILEKKWSSINPATIGDCSAVAYWYAKKLYKDLQVPIGLVVSNWGGTPAQAWTSFEGLHDFPDYSNTYVEKIRTLNLGELDKQRHQLKEKFEKDITEKTAFVQEAVKPGFDDSNWKEMMLPKPWEQQGYPSLDGIVIYRKSFNIAATDSAKEAVINMPAVDDMDSTYINGIFIGTTNQWDAIRKYKIPAGVLKPGKNSLVIKVQDNGGGGGLNNVESQFNIAVADKIIPLSGKAKFNIVAALMDITGGNGEIKLQPVVLYNGMIAPLLPLAIRGAIWYQGEENASKPIEYRSLFPSMITDWRNHWGQGDFPFLFVQLSSFGSLRTAPAESNWAALREAQDKTLYLPNTAMAVTIDVGNPADIHPKQKKEVGDRLALSAFKLVYGKTTLVSGGPRLSKSIIQGNQVILEFSNAANGLMVKGKQLKHFAIAGADKKFVWADAVIKNNKIIVSSSQIKKPVAVRYAWADSPVDANLYNSEGLPAAPFRTDDWKVQQ